MDDFKAASTIASDRLHVVIDLTGYTAGGRPEILALLQNSRIVGSPLRMSYLGWPSTMGSTDVMDVAVGDAIATPIEIAANQYAEKLVIMPRSFFFADHDFKMRNVPHIGDVGADTMVRLRHGQRKDILPVSSTASLSPHSQRDFVFANFNQLFKLDDPTQLDVWANILRAPRGRSKRSWLWLLRHPAVAEPRVLEQFRARGIKSEKRILFSDFAPKEKYLLRSLAADIFLDNPRYNARATGVDALYSRVRSYSTFRAPGRMGRPC